jgi:DNA-binding response OmpR family regulator
MGGEIGFDPDITRGARFYVKFPLLNTGQQTTEDAQEKFGQLPRILVVEDETDISELLAIMLTRCGYEVDQAHTGQQALDALANHSYSAMTLDLALPDISGLEIIRLTREQSETAHLPIIVLSAKMEAGRLEINGDFSDIDWLAKPLNEDLLLNRLAKQINGSAHKQMKVLHIEDDTDLQDVIRGMAGDNFQFTAAATISEACDAIETQTFDAIILDLVLPDGSGWDLLPLIKKKQQQARVVLLTGTEPSLEQIREVEATLLKTRVSARELIDALGNRIDASRQNA